MKQLQFLVGLVIAPMIGLTAIVGCTQRNTAHTAPADSKALMAALATNEMTATVLAVHGDDCSQSDAHLEFTVYNGGPDVVACQSYKLITQNSRNGETYNCDSPSKFVHPQAYGWTYSYLSSSWSSYQKLVDEAVPGDYQAHFRSSDGTEKSVPYSVRNPHGNPNGCVAGTPTSPTTTVPVSGTIPAEPDTGIPYPLTIVSSGNFDGTYNSYNDFAAKIIGQGYAQVCVNVNGVLAFGGFGPCVELKSNQGVGPTQPPVVGCSTSQPAKEFRTISCQSGQTGSITESRDYSCVGTSWAASNWTQTANSCIWPVVDSSPDSCVEGPVSATNELLFQGAGVFRMYSGQVDSFQLPIIPNGQNSAAVLFNDTTVSPAGATLIEVSISKCRGSINPTSICYNKNALTGFTKLDWVQQKPSGLTDDYMKNAHICLAPPSQGPWYVNFRYTYSQCNYSPCGFTGQLNFSGYGL